MSEMDSYGIEQVTSGVVDVQMERGFAEERTSESEGKLYDAADIAEQLSQQKDSALDHTPKANAASLPSPNATTSPVPSGNVPSRPTVQRSVSAITGSTRSRQNSHANHSTPRLGLEDGIMGLSPSAGIDSDAPQINVTPSSPRTNIPSSARSIEATATGTLASVAESPARTAREAADRRASRRRSGVDGTNNHRLSGFFSNLLHLRERDDAQPSSTRSTRHSTPARPSSPTLRGNGGSGALTGLAALGRPPFTEPLPPAMPAPTLSELGLSLSMLTDELPSNQFITPTSGTFLSPHYLLLCHSQGLDVMPLVNPPTIQPYALVRRVAFKSVVVMEERGVLVAIAGRRDGVRVYALDEIRKAVEWRIDVELRRELEKQRREEMKKMHIVAINPITGTHTSEEKKSTKSVKRKSASIDSLTASVASSAKTTSIRKRSKSSAVPPLPPLPPMPPPSFPPPRLIPRTSVANFHIHREANSRARAMSVAEAMGPHTLSTTEGDINEQGEGKGEWMDDRHSDDEVLIAAGPSGSAALDERTSAISAAQAQASGAGGALAGSIVQANPSSSGNPQRRRPANLDLSRANEHGQLPALSSPAPTLMSLRQALNHAPRTAETMRSDPDFDNEPGTPNGEVISFADILLESRIPDAPPLGQPNAQAPAAVVTRFPLSATSPSSHGYGGHGLSSTNSQRMVQQARNARGVAGLVEGELSDHDGETEMDHTGPPSRAPSRSGGSLRATNRRHRWSVLDGVFRPSGSTREPIQAARDVMEDDLPLEGARFGTPLTRTISDVSMHGSRSASRQGTGHRAAMSQPSDINATIPRSSSGISRFFPGNKKRKSRERRESNAASSSADHLHAPVASGGYEKLTGVIVLPPQAPPPKLEYVKLPGTKGAVMIKAVETAKKSFLAILCGDNGEKVELFAGTYRTALGLSRTFILPDSPKTLELQLQGDDLVEVFLVFSQNVFALEPATVRVREVRIGRAERRAARRRANRGINRQPTEDTNNEPPAQEDDVAITAIVAGSEAGHDDAHLFPNAASRTDSRRNPAHASQDSPAPSAPTSSAAPHFPPDSAGLPPLGPPTTPHPEDLAAAAMIAMGPYTTFQQLSFAPPFPLATLAEECMIPPTYKSVIDYKDTYEKDEDEEETAEVETVPEDNTASHDVQWLYKDPRGIVRGPWASSLMQSWFKDDFLPPDLPVRRETETEYTSLRELQRQSIDPNSPFRPPPPGLTIPALRISPLRPEGVNPLLEPISLLTQEKRLGPPALFYSSRGGHSTSIVDARGRSVLKGRFYWSSDDAITLPVTVKRLGDVKRLEAFEVGNDKAVVVAFRQGGLEAAEVGDAIMTPGDECRTIYPYFEPPSTSYNRRRTFIWRTGQPISAEATVAPPNAITPAYSSQVNLASKTQTSTPTPTSAAAKRRSLNPNLLSNNRGLTGKSGPFSDTEDERDHFLGTQEALLVLGRFQDKVYFCDRRSGSFRLMVLSTTTPSS